MVKGKVYSTEKTFACYSQKKRSGSIVRLSIPAFRAEDPGSNPGRSTIHPDSFNKTIKGSYIMIGLRNDFRVVIHVFGSKPCDEGAQKIAIMNQNAT